MIRLQDIADLAGVSRTTVSNVLYGKTARVSPETIAKITKLIKETGYVPNMGSLMLTKNQSFLIGLVIWSDENYGINILKDPFITEFLAAFEQAAKAQGYYVMIIRTKSISELTNIMNRCYVDGFVFIGYEGIYYNALAEKINKNMVLIDAYPKHTYNFHNVGIDDFDGGYQAGDYLLSLGYNKALYLSEHDVNGDYQRWLGFKKAQRIDAADTFEKFLLLPTTEETRRDFYTNNISKFLKAEALFFASDYLAIEAINCFSDYGIVVPDAISVIGFDDSMYCNLSRPKLTTIKQDVSEKAVCAFNRLLKLINKEEVQNFCIRNPVKIIQRDSVK